jgi:hypothetical protein
VSEGLEPIRPGERVGPHRVLRGFERHGGTARVSEVEVREKYRRPGLPRRLALEVVQEEYQAALVAESDSLSRPNHPDAVCIFPFLVPGRPRYAAREQFRFRWASYCATELPKRGSVETRLTRLPGAPCLLCSPPDRDRRMSLLESLGMGRHCPACPTRAACRIHPYSGG